MGCRCTGTCLTRQSPAAESPGTSHKGMHPRTGGPATPPPSRPASTLSRPQREREDVATLRQEVESLRAALNAAQTEAGVARTAAHVAQEARQAAIESVDRERQAAVHARQLLEQAHAEARADRGRSPRGACRADPSNPRRRRCPRRGPQRRPGRRPGSSAGQPVLLSCRQPPQQHLATRASRHLGSSDPTEWGCTGRWLTNRDRLVWLGPDRRPWRHRCTRRQPLPRRSPMGFETDRVRSRLRGVGRHRIRPQQPHRRHSRKQFCRCRRLDCRALSPRRVLSVPQQSYRKPFQTAWSKPQLSPPFSPEFHYGQERL